MKVCTINVIADDEERLPQIAERIADAIQIIEYRTGQFPQTQVNIQIAPLLPPTDEQEGSTTDAIGFRFGGTDDSGDDYYEEDRRRKTVRKGLKTDK
jgi:hypothetical protein